MQHIQPLRKISRAGARLAGYCPLRVRNQLFQPLLNHALKSLMEEGELDFLIHKTCAINVRNSRLCCVITYQDNRLKFLPEYCEAEVTISADSDAFLALITQSVDPDTLFFRRQLLIEGDVELGLYLKNMLDALNAEDLPPMYRQAIEGLRKLAQLEKVEDDNNG